MTPETAAWMAGLIDGDGYIMGNLTKSGGAQIGIRIKMCNLPTIHRCKELTGTGWINPEGRTANGRQCWSWMTRDRADTAAVLSTLQPYLYTRLAQAICALEMATAPRGDLPALAARMAELNRAHKTLKGD